MKKLRDISGQAFFCANVEKMLGEDFCKNNCAVILTKADLNIFLEMASQLVGNKINQIIVINANANVLYKRFKDLSNVFIISALNLEDAIQISLNSSSFCKNVICITNTLKEEVKSNMLKILANKI